MKKTLLFVSVLSVILLLGYMAFNKTPSVAETKVDPVASIKAFVKQNSAHAENKKTQTKIEPSNDVYQRILALTNKSDFQQSLLDDQAIHNRYPEHNSQFSNPEFDPLSKRYALDERVSKKEGTHETLTVWSDKKFYQQGDDVQIFAQIKDGAEQAISGDFSAKLIYEESQLLDEYILTDEDSDKISELFLSAQDIESKQYKSGIYKLLIHSKTLNISDSVVFSISSPDALFTGEYRDSLNDDGDLLVEAQVDVAKEGRFYFQASLYSSPVDAIGSSQHSAELGTGQHWVPLSFDGLMIKDSGEKGPYLLQQISLAKVTMPIQRGPLLQPGYYTQAYDLSQLATASN